MEKNSVFKVFGGRHKKSFWSCAIWKSQQRCSSALPTSRMHWCRKIHWWHRGLHISSDTTCTPSRINTTTKPEQYMAKEIPRQSTGAGKFVGRGAAARFPETRNIFCIYVPSQSRASRMLYGTLIILSFAAIEKFPITISFRWVTLDTNYREAHTSDIHEDCTVATPESNTLSLIITFMLVALIVVYGMRIQNAIHVSRGTGYEHLPRLSGIRPLISNVSDNIAQIYPLRKFWWRHERHWYAYQMIYSWSLFFVNASILAPLPPHFHANQAPVFNIRSGGLCDDLHCCGVLRQCK
jgi:hypothetical protein